LIVAFRSAKVQRACKTMRIAARCYVIRWRQSAATIILNVFAACGNIGGPPGE